MSQPFHIVIPARLQSTRFPGKLLQCLDQKTILEHVFRRCCLANPYSITIATDDKSIEKIALGFGASVVMTQVTHPSGTDRVAEAVSKLQLSDDAVVVNVQADEPFIEPKLISQVACSLYDGSASMATLCWPIESQEMLLNPNVVKVVRNCQGKALYFSRSPIPYSRDMPGSIQYVFRHIGLYAYRVGFLKHFVQMPICPLEEIEALEQLRALWIGADIKVETASVLPKQDINTPEDLVRARSLLQSYV